VYLPGFPLCITTPLPIGEPTFVIVWSDRYAKKAGSVLGIVRRGFDGANSRIVVVEALLAM
jgi:hypothetical protein